MADRFTRGFTTGIISGLVMTLLNMSLGLIGIRILSWLDWMAVILFDHAPPFSFGESFLAFLAMPIFYGTAGAVFSLLLPLITNRNLLLKGWLWGVSIWFLLDGITSIFKIEQLTHLSVVDSTVGYVTASFYGLFLAQLLYRVEKVDVTVSISPQPAMKPLENNDVENNGDK